MNEVTTADVTELWRVGKVDLPTVAAQYAEVASLLHKTALSDTAMFTTSEGLSVVHEPFTQIRDLLQDRMAVQSAQRLQKAGKAIVQIADSFATTDYLSAKEIEQYADFKEGVRTGPEEEQPPYVPPAPKSTDPHPEENVHDYPGPPR